MNRTLAGKDCCRVCDECAKYPNQQIMCMDCVYRQYNCQNGHPEKYLEKNTITTDEMSVDLKIWLDTISRPGISMFMLHQFAVTAARRALYAEAKLAAGDNPIWDATDGAHPAWWRGDDHGHEQTVFHVNKILDGNFIEDGACAAPWDKCKKRLVELYKKAQAYDRIVNMVRSLASGCFPGT